jgi:hypothetical protein
VRSLRAQFDAGIGHKGAHGVLQHRELVDRLAEGSAAHNLLLVGCHVLQREAGHALQLALRFF